MCWIRRTHLLLVGGFLSAAPALCHAQPTARFKDVVDDALPGNPAVSEPSESSQPSSASSSLGPRPRQPLVRAAELLWHRGRELEARSDVAGALASYTRAVALDQTYGPAWLSLGRLRAALRDDLEAERVLTNATHFADVAADAYAARAELHGRRGQYREAVHDSELALRLDPSAARVRQLSTYYVEVRAWPAALALWRRFAAHHAQGPADVEDAQLQIRALSLLAGETDPVTNGADDRNWVRRSLARIAETQAQ